jgi:hypothetical protein
MIGIPAEIEKQIRRKYGKNDKIANMVYNLMVGCNQSYSDIMKMPLPLAFALLERLQKEQKELEKKHGRKH